MSAEKFHQILKFGREKGRRSLVLSGAHCTKLRRPLSLPNFKIWWNCSVDMNRNVKDYLILKGDFDFAIPWIPLAWGCQHPHFKWYSMFSLGLPLIMTIITLCLQQSSDFLGEDFIKPGIGNGSCFFNESLPTFLYFHIINASAMVISSFLIARFSRDHYIL